LIVSTPYKLNAARMHFMEMKKLDCAKQGALWGDENEHFNLELGTCGVDLKKITNTVTCPKRVSRCWIE
jgi:hypothetical protein